MVQRVAIVGCIGAGKSTLARTLGERLGHEVVHLDRHWWEDSAYVIRGRSTARDRTMSPDDFRHLQQRVVAGRSWIVDGDASCLDVRLSRADTIIFMDLPIWLCAWRVLRRPRAPRLDYPPGVVESWRWTAVLLHWIMWNYPRHRRRDIEQAVADYGMHARVVRLRTRRQVEGFLRSVPERGESSTVRVDNADRVRTLRVVAAAGVVVRDNQGRVLLVQRASDGCWAVPGGHLEPGETWQQCAEREFAEETGLRVEVTGLLGIYSDPETQRSFSDLWREPAHFVGVIFYGSLSSTASAQTGSSEIIDVGWFSATDMPSPLFSPDVPVLADALGEAPPPFLR
jgi:8-oxo-dGTP diphosphatase